MHTPLPLKTFLVVPETPPLDGVAVSSHPEQELEEEPALRPPENHPPLPEPKDVIAPSLATLERAVSARIYFENLYFSLLRQPPSREYR